MTKNFSLLKRSVALFPRKPYLQDSTVRHNRRQYPQAVAFLRDRDESKWILDKPVVRKCAS